ncbi:MAG: tRNA (N6-isopentenyl adenosine(37)-C2)-methylthiotransferase MiaB [Devosiaceae bacterium]|nr:tRNA (N6-isopentenyl adenosine(37)-C2)-methylthiotransferase MiaB [Devosiaceae bacterium]
MKKLFIKTFGCQMNVYDSTRMIDSLSENDYEETKIIEQADLLILNTCHIREKATEKVFSEIGRMKELRNKRRENGQDMIIAVAGCVAQAQGEEIMARAPVVSLVFGPQSYHKLPELVKRAANERVIDTDFPIEDKFNFLPKAKNSNIIARGLTAFLTVQEGCDKFCSFCVVPYTRGSEVSRPLEQVILEAKSLVAGGVMEITLLGQNVNAYHGENSKGKAANLAELLYALAKIDGLERLRYTTSHPNDMDQTLINAHKDLSTLMPYLHLPVQSGSNKILKAMNRSHTAEKYLEIIERLREARPDIALSGDFIVGFPNESDKDFEDTLKIIRQSKYSSAYSFKYSPRPGTPGALMDNQIPEKIRSERLTILQKLLNEQQTKFNLATIGRTVPVLFDKKGRSAGQIGGRSPYLQPIHLSGSEDLIGTIENVKIISGDKNSLTGELVKVE